MTIREYTTSIPESEALKILSKFTPDNYVAYDYIDWKRFLDSDYGNGENLDPMKFLRTLYDFTDDGEKFSIVDELNINDADYVAVYAYSTDEIIYLPYDEDKDYHPFQKGIDEDLIGKRTPYDNE